MRRQRKPTAKAAAFQPALSVRLTRAESLGKKPGKFVGDSLGGDIVCKWNMVSVISTQDGTPTPSPPPSKRVRAVEPSAEPTPAPSPRTAGAMCVSCGSKKSKAACTNTMCLQCCLVTKKPCASHSAQDRKFKEDQRKAKLAIEATLKRAEKGNRYHNVLKSAVVEGFGKTVTVFSLHDFLRDESASRDALEDMKRAARRGALHGNFFSERVSGEARVKRWHQIWEELVNEPGKYSK